MANITLHDNPIKTIGTLPEMSSKAPDFQLTKTDLSDASLKDFTGKRLVLNIFPSIDTGVCATAVRRFNAEAEKLKNTAVLCISADLPFAQARFCGAEGLDRVINLSAMREQVRRGLWSNDYRWPSGGAILTSRRHSRRKRHRALHRTSSRNYPGARLRSGPASP